jgi:tellurite resistance protein
MRPVRTFLSDGLLRRFTTHLSVMRHQGLRNALAEHQVLEARIHAVESDRHFDTIHVAFRAAAKDVEVDANLTYEQAMQQAAKARREEWTEIWSFLRRPGAKTLAGGGAVEGYCPNCGGPIEVGQTTSCEHCQALINSGDYDWVLAEITQTIEWRPSSTGDVPGLAQLAARDPAFNRQAAEDRASYVFWRWVEARVLANAAPLAKCASPELHARIADQVKAGGAQMFKTAVGSVDLVACEAGPEGGRDRFHVKILWSTAVSNKASPSPAANVFSLGRKAGSVDDGSLSHARCPECHGPLSENDSPECEYCGANLSAGDKEWVLENVLRPEELRLQVQPQAVGVPGASGEFDVPAWATPDMGNPRERMLLMMRMAAVVVADGQITKEERKLLKAASKRWSVPLEAVEPILTGQVPAESVATMVPSNPGAFLSGLIAAALIDGKIDSKEEKLLLDVGRSMGMSDADTRNYMNAMSQSVQAR